MSPFPISRNAIRTAALAACLALSGCAQTATMMVWQPAEADVSGIHRLAVLEFRGNGDSGTAARTALVSGIWNTGFYTLVDPSQTSRVAQASAQVPEAPPDIAAAIETGRRLGADAVLVGDVVHSQAGDREAPFRDDDPGGNPRMGGRGRHRGGMHRIDYLDRDVSVALAYQLIDVRTGQVRAESRTSYQSGGVMLNGQGSPPKKETVLAELMTRCSRDIVLSLTPRQIAYQVQLADPGFLSGSGDVRRGNEFAAAGDWAKAEILWDAALTTDPKNYAALYNLSMAAAARYDYPRAVSLLTEAVKLHGSDEYREALTRLKRHEQDYQIVVDQKNNPGPAASARVPGRPSGGA